MLTDKLIKIGTNLALRGEPQEVRDTWASYSRGFLQDHSDDELTLQFVWMGLTVAATIVLIACAWVGDQISPHAHRVGVDLGASLGVFAVVGVFVHCARYLLLNLSVWLVRARARHDGDDRQREILKQQVPGTVYRRLVLSSDRDLVFQMLTALAALAIGLTVNS